MTMDFERDVLAKIRGYLGRRVRFPEIVGASASDDGEWVTIHAELPASALTENMQSDAAAGSTFAWTMAYWHEKASGRPTRSVVAISGDPPADGGALLHWRRSQFLLQEFSTLLGERFQCRPPASWAWPEEPVLNAPLSDRSDSPVTGNREHEIEMALTTTRPPLDSFRAEMADVVEFNRQLPVGLFAGRKAKETAWTPGGSSQGDVWACSKDAKVFHLFELKAGANAHVGIVPEAFYYARLLHYVRVGLPNGTRIGGGGAAIDAVRRAERIVAWLVAPTYHPLVYPLGTDGSAGNVPLDSPLAWLNQATASQGLELRILPYEENLDVKIAWRPQLRWPND